MNDSHEQDRFHERRPAPAPNADESLVRDARDGLSPAQLVERKLIALLRHAPLPVTRLDTAAPRRAFH